MFEEIIEYINANYKPEKNSVLHRRIEGVKSSLSREQLDNIDPYDAESLKKALNTYVDKELKPTFVEKVLEFMKIKALNSPDVYNAIGMDRRYFSKLISDSSKRPVKDACLSICLGLKLKIEEADNLLNLAGYSFSPSNKRDLIIEYFIKKQIFDIIQINETLDYFKEKILGSFR